MADQVGVKLSRAPRGKTEKVDFDLILDYINTSCAKKLFELLKTLDANTSVSAININWYYQDWDEDNLETGQILNDLS